MVEYNKTRMALNSIKAHHETSGTNAPDLLIATARHTLVREDVHQSMQQICLQTYNSKLPAELELYIGAPVILKVSRYKNLMIFDCVLVTMPTLNCFNPYRKTCVWILMLSMEAKEFYKRSIFVHWILVALLLTSQ